MHQSGAEGGPLHEHVGPVLGVLIGELLENEVLTPESAELVGELLDNEALTNKSAKLREEHMRLS